ncbi:MAG: hypothetical protein V1709_11295 [Planctomycetota bacterium]
MKNKLLIIMGALIFTLFIKQISAYAFFGDEFNLSPEEAKKSMEEDRKWRAWLKKYIKDVLYVGMSENEFVKLFTKDESWTDSESPYIISQNKNRYVFMGLNKNKFRVTFKNGLLEKLEEYGWEKFILCYNDVSTFLKGYNDRYATAFYDGMSEEEFLKLYSGSILVHKKDWYVVQERDGRKFQLKFKNGYLIGMAGEKAPWE